MTFIGTIPDDQASGVLAKLYDEERADDRYVWNTTRAFSHRPEVLRGWNEFLSGISANMDPRRYELATLAAARRLRSSYCMLAHGSAAAARCFMSKVVDAVGALADHAYEERLDSAQREALTVGRPIAAS